MVIYDGSYWEVRSWLFGGWFGRLVVINVVSKMPGRLEGRRFSFLLLYCYLRERNCTALGWEYLL